RRALVKHRANLLFQRARAPVLDAAHLGIEVALKRVVDCDDLPEMCPAQLCPQCGHNLEIREDLSKSDHAEEAPLPEAPAELRLQLSPQCGDNLSTIVGPLFF